MTTSLPDFDDLKRLRRLGRKMSSVYKEMDLSVVKAMDGMKVSCKVGCASCCNLLVLASLPEAVAVAEYILSSVERRKLVPELSKRFWQQAEAIEQGGLRQIRVNYLKKKVPCGLLNTDNNTCMAYEARPGACRYHHVVTPPENCADPEAAVGRVDTRGVELALLSEANKVSKQTKLPLYVAPLPVVMLWAFKLLIEGRKAFEDALKDPNLGILSLDGWMQTLRADEAPEAPGAAEPPSEEKTPTPETIPEGSG